MGVGYRLESFVWKIYARLTEVMRSAEAPQVIDILAAPVFGKGLNVVDLNVRSLIATNSTWTLKCALIAISLSNLSREMRLLNGVPGELFFGKGVVGE